MVVARDGVPVLIENPSFRIIAAATSDRTAGGSICS